MIEPQDTPKSGAGAPPLPESVKPDRLPWIAPLAIWALVQAVILAVGASPLLDGELIGTDGYMRLVRVELLHETGAWFDGRIPRSNAPFGEILHWTRPLDILMLGAAWPLMPFLSAHDALFWGGAFISPVLLLAATFVMIWAARPLIDASCRPYIVVAVLAQMAVLSYAMPGRIDHHALQFLLIAATVGLILRLCTDRPEVWLAAAAGAVLGAGLWVSVEFLLAIALTISAVWLSWLRGDQGRGAPPLALALALAAGVGLALWIERPLGSVLVEEYDRLSVAHLALVVLHVAFWAFAWLVGPALSLRGRLIFSVFGALAAGGAIFAVYPKFFGGTDVYVHPELVRVYFSNVKELQPILPTDLESLGRFLFWVGPALVCLPFALGLAWTARRERAAVVWLYFALALGFYVAMSLRHVRFAPFAEIMAVVPLVYLVQVLRARLGWIRRAAWRDAARSVVSLGLILGISGAGLVLGYRPAIGPQVPPSRGAGAPVGVGMGPCNVRRLAAFLNRADGLGDRQRTIVTHVDFGPELLYRTGHAVLAGPYHRNKAGILDIYRFFTAIDDERNKALIEKRGIDLALLCPGSGERLVYAPDGSGTMLYERLLDGNLPPWLEPVTLPKALAGFRLFQVVGP